MDFPRGSFSSKLQKIFYDYRISSNKVIDISDIRKQLAQLYYSTGQFEIDYPGDSIEALLEILHIIHNETFSQQTTQLSNMKCTPLCPAHVHFSLQVEDSLVCQCREIRKDMWDFSAFAHHFYVASLFEGERGDQKKLLEESDKQIEDLVQYSSVMFCESRLCDFMKDQWKSILNICIKDKNPCAFKQTSRCLTLLQSPAYYIIHLIWENSRPSLINLLEVYSSIPYSLNINQIYTTTESKVYIINSMILYGTGHYITLIKKNAQWFKVDDESILQLGQWKDIITYILRSRFYPVGLFYSTSQKHESNGMGIEDWIRFERDVLQTIGIREVKNSPSGWNCECGNFNCKSFEICELCSKLKPGVNGWVCSFCTALNDMTGKYCKACGNLYNSPKRTIKTSHNFNKSIKNKTINENYSRNKGLGYEKNPKTEKAYTESYQKPEIKGHSRNSSFNSEPKCRVCMKKVAGNEFICIKCYVKSYSSVCQLCKNQAFNDCCDTCIRLSYPCADCRKINLIIDLVCDCKKRNFTS